MDLRVTSLPALREWYEKRKAPLTVRQAVALRDRAAGLLLSNPAESLELGAFLVDAHEENPVNDELGAIAWRARAEALTYMGNLKDAIASYQRACDLAAPHPALLGQILVGRIGALTAVGRAEEGEAFVSRAQTLLRNARDSEYLGKLFMNLGSAAFHREEFAQTYQHYTRAEEFLGRKKDATWLMLQVNLGIACTELSRIEEADEAFRTSEAAARRLELPHLVAHCQFDRAFLEALRGNYREALRLLEQAEEIFRGLGATELRASTLLARARFSLELGLCPEARDLADEAGTLFEAEEKQLDRELAGTVEAAALIELRRFRSAEAVLVRAESVYRKKGIRPRRVRVLLDLARLHRSRGDLEESRSFARLALNKARPLGLVSLEAEARCELAESELEIGRPGRAERILAPALAGAKERRAGQGRKIWNLAGRISRARGKSSEAIRRFRKAVRLLEDEQQLIPGIELRSRAFEYQFETYRDLIAAIAGSRRASSEELFVLSEAARARGFRERRMTSGPKLPAEILEKRTRLGSLAGRLEGIELGDRTASDRERSELRKDVKSLEREVRRGLQTLESGDGSARPGGMGVSIETLRRRLGKNHALVEFLLLPDGVLTFVLTRESVRHRKLDLNVDELSGTIDTLRHQFDTFSVSGGSWPADPAFLRRTAEEHLRRLFSATLEPLLDLIPAHGRLTLVPHGPLQRVPFESLHDGEDYIDRKWVVHRIPTATLLRRPTRRRPAGNMTISGVVTHGPTSSAEEMDTVASFFPGRSEVVRDPTKDQLLQCFGRSSLQHVIAHGSFRADNPEFSLLSAADGPLYVLDLFETRRKFELVVLSACSSGETGTGLGEEFSGVAHGFLRNGARALISSLWPIEDASATRLVREFYRSYTSDRPDPVEARAEAARAVRAEWNHPYYWSSFCVHGG